MDASDSSVALFLLATNAPSVKGSSKHVLIQHWFCSSISGGCARPKCQLTNGACCGASADALPCFRPCNKRSCLPLCSRACGRHRSEQFSPSYCSENLFQAPQGDGMILFRWQDDIIGVARFIDTCLERVYTSAGLLGPWGTRHLISPELAAREGCNDSCSSSSATGMLKRLMPSSSTMSTHGI